MLKIILSIFIFLPSFLVAQTNFTITGKVSDVNGNPLNFVNVVLNKNNIYTVSDDKGKYQLKKVIKGEYTITISSLGFESIVNTINVTDDLNLNFTLKEESENLDNIDIIAKKGSTKQKEQAISIGSFELSDVVANTNIITDEIDKVSGVRIRRSGSLGDNSDISISGLKGSAVRIYIDGVPFEFLYPTLDLSNVPLTDIKRVDVYKGVMPVDIGTDALGGGINIVTGGANKNHAKASYSIGSFNTHLGDVSLTLVDDNDNFFSVNGGVNYSDNDYKFNANVVQTEFIDENNPSFGTKLVELKDQEVTRFHDRYRLQHSSTTIGTSNKKWTDNVSISLNYLNSFKEIQNTNRITNQAIGEAVLESENVSTILKYIKTIFKDKLKLRTISNYSRESVKFVDSTANKYNWFGDVYAVNTNSKGEFDNGTPAILEAESHNYVNRSSLVYNINDTNNLLLSNIIAHQKREIVSYDFDLKYFETEPLQKITKDILGLQYQGKRFEDKLEFGATLKYYNFDISSLDTKNGELQQLKDDFIGWNASVKYNIFSDLAIRGSYERGFLIPEIYQFAGNGSTTIGNAGIKPEESDNVNLGFLYSNIFNDEYAITLSTNAFLRKQRNIIFLNVEDNPAQFINGENADTKGIETEFKLKFLKDFNLTTNISYLEQEFVSVESEINDYLIGTPVPNTPSFFYNTQLNWSKKNVFKSNVDVSIYGAFTHVSAFNIILIGQQDTPENSPDSFVPDSNRIDTGISLQFLEKKITTAFNVVNITDEELYDNYSIPRPGRSFNFKIIYELSNF